MTRLVLISVAATLVIGCGDSDGPELVDSGRDSAVPPDSASGSDASPRFDADIRRDAAIGRDVGIRDASRRDMARPRRDGGIIPGFDGGIPRFDGGIPSFDGSFGFDIGGGGCSDDTECDMTAGEQCCFGVCLAVPCGF